MALQARREYSVQQPTVPQQPERQPVRRKKIWITKGEKVLYLSFLTALVLCAVLILQNQATIQAATQEIQSIERSIDEKMKQNTDLSVQVSDLSRYERIWSKAKESGLKLNDQNVKVVPGQ